jgi:hypothetical protein
MALSAAQIRLLKRKAAANTLEVENLIKVALVGGPGDAPLLRQLKAEHRWSNSGRKGRTRVVPFGRWAEVVCCYLEDGSPGLIRLARGDKRFFDFCVSLLEEFPTSEGMAALLAIGREVLDDPATNRPRALRLAWAFNCLLSCNGQPELPDVEARQVRAFLHRLLSSRLSQGERVGCVCALRHVGDASSLELVEQLPPFTYPWAGVERVICRQLKKRLRVEKC